MAATCYAYRMTPAEYRALTVGEHRALVDHLEQVAKRARAADQEV